MFQNINENTIDGHNYKEEKKKIDDMLSRGEIPV